MDKDIAAYGQRLLIVFVLGAILGVLVQIMHAVREIRDDQRQWHSQTESGSDRG